MTPCARSDRISDQEMSHNETRKRDRPPSAAALSAREKIDLNGMAPAAHGTSRACPADFIGGRRDGQSATVGWHPTHRDEVGRDLDETARELPPQHYVLFKSNSGNLLHYVHSSLLPDSECA
jgi:hypothetical protein